MGFVKGVLATIRDDNPIAAALGERGGVAVLFLTSSLFVLATGLATLKFTTDHLNKAQHREVLHEDMDTLVTMLSFALDQELACSMNLIEVSGQGVRGQTLSKAAMERIDHRLQYLAPATYESGSAVWGEPIIDLRDQSDSVDSKRFFQRLEILSIRLVRGVAIPKTTKPDYVEVASNESAYLVHLQISAASAGSGARKATVVREIPIYMITDGSDKPIACQATRYLDSNTHTRIIAGHASSKNALQNSTLEDRACQIRLGVPSPNETQIFKFDPVYNRCLEMDIGSLSGPLLSSTASSK